MEVTSGADTPLYLSNETNASLASNMSDVSLSIEASTRNIIVGCVLAAIVLVIFIGNAMVLLSVMLFSHMRTSSHGLITSLACADFGVGVIVMPFSIYSELANGRWLLDSHLCDLWITADVTFCTASILNVCAIAVDRYLKITRDTAYTHGKILSRKHICSLMISMSWIIAVAVACAPLLGWKKGTENSDPRQCMISQDTSYTFFSTFGAFYVPVMFMITVYCRIYHVAIWRLRSREKEKSKTRKKSIQSINSREFGNKRPSIATNVQQSTSIVEYQATDAMDTSAKESSQMNQQQQQQGGNDNTRLLLLRTVKRRSSNTMQGVNRATRMLGVIIGCFVACWLPFFIVAVIQPLCSSCQVPRHVGSVVLWLGYTNSLVNPFIYAIWNKEYQDAFKRIILCRTRTKLRLNKKLSVVYHFPK